MAIERDQTQSPAVVEAGEVQELKKQISELTEQVVLTMSKNETRRGNRTPRRCFNCRGVGHLQRDFPSPRIPQAGERRVCWTCGQPGHVAFDCPQENERGAVASPPPSKLSPHTETVAVATVKECFHHHRPDTHMEK